MRTSVAIAALGILLSISSSPAQFAAATSWDDLPRDETIAEVSDVLAKINAPFARATASDPAAGMLEDMMQNAIREVLALRDNLASNPYIRVSSFSVGFPSGVSVEFTFPPNE